MLERIQVPHDIAVKVNHKEIFEVVKNISLKRGRSEEDARISADVLIHAEVRGMESHGVSNMLRRNVEAWAEKEINPTPKPKVIRGKGAVATLDTEAGQG
jgi:Malate/L-lactate dehydrogenases